MIERTYTLTKRFMLLAWGTVIGFFLTSLAIKGEDAAFFSEGTLLAGTLLGILIVQMIFAPIRFHGNILKKRARLFITDPAITALQSSSTLSSPVRTPNFRMIAKRDPRFHSFISGDDWRYGDHTHAIYEKTKHSEYKAATVYYSILELDLPRKLPNLLFDSTKAHRKQFSVFFDRSQCHSLEGNFDQHFTTYFPKFYTIDSLSIISPEVMQAMIEADQFDIEIVGDKLYLFGPLIPVSQIPAMIEKGKKIREKLLNNIVTYRDERLDAAVGRQEVSTFGAGLRSNPWRGWPVALLGFSLLAFSLYILATDPSADKAFEGVIYGAVMGGGSGFGMWRQWQKNAEQDKLYATLLAAKAYKDSRQNR